MSGPKEPDAAVWEYAGRIVRIGKPWYDKKGIHSTESVTEEQRFGAEEPFGYHVCRCEVRKDHL